MSTLLESVGDRVNPILVKEVRQAMRGRLFRFGFGFTLIGGLTVALMTLMLSERHGVDRGGAQLAMSIFVCLLVANFSFVPFSAFMSMGGEWDENTHDLLVLSNLGPRRIVLGKLGSAAVQSLLCFSAFAPFFVFAFLLRGVNLPSLLLLLGGALVLSPCASLIALGVSSLTTNRFLRVLLIVALCAGLLTLTISSSAFATFALTAVGFGPTTSQLAMIVGGLVSVGLAVALFFGEVACVRLAHPEENRSTGLRLTMLLVLAGALTWTAIGARSGAPSDFLSAIGIGLAFAFVLPCAFFASEPEKLGRRVLRHVPKNPLLALLVAPLLPGGGRGMLFTVLLGALIVGGLVTIQAVYGTVSLGTMIGGPGGITPWRPARTWTTDGFVSMLLAGAFSLFYVGIPTGLLSRIATTARLRAGLRAFVPLLAFVMILLPSLVLFFQRGPRESIFHHWLNPFWMIDRCWSRETGSGMLLAIGLGAAALLVNFPRMTRGVGEVLGASATRRALERVAAKHPADPTPDAAAPA